MKSTTHHGIMKKLLAFMLATPVILSHANGFAQLVDRIVAIVNDDIITLTELENESQQYSEMMSQSSDAVYPEKRKYTKEQLLTKLINQKLITQEAQKAQIKITDAELERNYRENLQKMNVGRAEFLSRLEKSGLTEEKYKDELRSKLLRDKLVAYEVRSKTIITEEMMLDYYTSEYTNKITEDGYYILQMGFTWGKDNTAAAKQAAYQRAEKARDLVINGADFGTTAHQLSDFPSAVDGGDLGVIQEDDMAKYMRQAVLPLDAGGISKVIETPIGYQFFKLVALQKDKAASQVPYYTVKKEVRSKLLEKKFAEEYKAWVENIKQRSYVKKMLN